MRINHATQCISRPTSPFRDDDQRAEEKNSIDDPNPYPTQTLANAQKKTNKSNSICSTRGNAPSTSRD